jgi:outer membrane protein OmpA-like peptidoglycan-associated protein/thiol-disulfide isomerase/thioredoxin
MPVSHRAIAVFIVVVFHGFFIRAQQAIRFENLKWKAVLEKAKKENRMIFLDCYTAWCGPCKWMEKNVYTNDTIASFYNSNFICVKTDMEKNEGFDLAKKYNITAYPTLLYLTASGEVAHRTCGASPVSEFLENGKDALNPEKQLAYYAKKFNEAPGDPKNSFLYFEKLQRACLLDENTIPNYFKTQKDNDLLSFYNWQLMFRYAGYSSRPFHYLEANKDAFSKLYTKDSVDLKINEEYALELRKALAKRDDKSVKLLRKNLLKLNTKGGNTVILHSMRKLKNSPDADMKQARVIRDSVVGPVNVSKGFGKVNDFYVYGMRYKEENSIWFRLDITHDTILTFDIVPADSLDDYDFTVFKCETGNCVAQVNTHKLQPIRVCRSYCTSKSGVTGLSSYTTKEFVDAGAGPAYASAIPVKAGETYYIEVDYGQNYIASQEIPIGFSIYFYNYWPRKKTITLTNVLFDHDKAVLTGKSFPDLDKLVLQLKKSQMKIEIRGHADHSGNEAKNQVLSEERAKAVINYLISKGINKDRLFYKGYGSTKPVASNDSDEGRRQNRRVEFVIVMQ